MEKDNAIKIISDAEFRSCLVDMLRYLTELCESNYISFYIFYGSLAGTMRHHSFIPWNDDIDVIIPRPDYEKLIFVSGHMNSRYRVLSIHTNDSFIAPLAKFIDTKRKFIQYYGYKENVDLGTYRALFIVNGFPDSEVERKK